MNCVFNGVTLSPGQNVKAYLNSSSSVVGGSCISETRTCLETGELTGSYQYGFCNSLVGAESCLFNGRTIPHGSNIIAYLNSSANSGCVSQMRICDNGILSGNYEFASCEPSYSSCLFNGMTLGHGQAIYANETSSVSFGQTCERVKRVCIDGVLSGSASYSSCTVGSARGCVINGRTINHNQSIRVFQSSSVASGQVCVSEQRTCVNGYLNGSYINFSCEVNAPISCSLNGVNIAHGQKVIKFKSKYENPKEQCEKEERTCSSGVLSGSAIFDTCEKNVNFKFKDRTKIYTDTQLKTKLEKMGFDNSIIRDFKDCENKPSANFGSDINFLAFGDSQYGLETETQKNDREANLLNIKALNSINNKRWPTDFQNNGKINNIRGVLIAGDITQHGYSKNTKDEFNHFLNDYGLCGDKKLNYPIYEGYGNHDVLRGKDIYYNNYVVRALGLRNFFRKDVKHLTQEFRGHYSWKWDKIHFSNLNIKAGEKHEHRPLERDPNNSKVIKHINPRKPLNFLKKDLWDNVGDSGRPVIIMMHYPPNNDRVTNEEQNDFYNIIKHYNVIAIIVGHAHKSTHYKWKGIDVFESGGPFIGKKKDKFGYFALFNISQNKLKVAEIPWSIKSNGNVELHINKGKYKLGADQKTQIGLFIKNIKMNDADKKGLRN